MCDNRAARGLDVRHGTDETRRYLITSTDSLDDSRESPSSGVHSGQTVKIADLKAGIVSEAWPSKVLGVGHPLQQGISSI
jgi:hypothetical protein